MSLLDILDLARNLKDAVDPGRTIVAVPAKVVQEAIVRVQEDGLVLNHKKRVQTASLAADQDHKTGTQVRNKNKFWNSI